MQTTSARGEMPLAVRWLRATFVGYVAGFVLAIVFIIAAESAGLRETQFTLALGMGTGVSWVQSRLLTPFGIRRQAWLAATALGLAVPFMVADLAPVIGLPLKYSLPWFVTLGGITAGFLQWRLLRAAAPRTHWWLVASPAGWLLAGSTVALNDLLPKIPGITGALIYVAVILIGGALLGAVTGPVLPALPKPSQHAGAYSA